MDKVISYLPILIPYLLISCGLAVFALVHVLRHNQYRFGSKAFWAVVVVFVQIIGPVAYLAFGRGEE